MTRVHTITMALACFASNSLVCTCTCTHNRLIRKPHPEAYNRDRRQRISCPLFGMSIPRTVLKDALFRPPPASVCVCVSVRALRSSPDFALRSPTCTAHASCGLSCAGTGREMEFVIGTTVCLRFLFSGKGIAGGINFIQGIYDD